MRDEPKLKSKLDRHAQRRILLRLADVYPEDQVAEFLYHDVEPYKLAANISYLQEHGLIEATFYGPKEVGNAVQRARLTHKGMDFLEDDGGLSSILDVVTVRIHEDSIKELIAAQISASDLAQPDKQRYLDQLRELPAETTKHLVLKMVDAGLANWQKALPLLQSILG